VISRVDLRGGLQADMTFKAPVIRRMHHPVLENIAANGQSRKVREQRESYLDGLCTAAVAPDEGSRSRMRISRPRPAVRGEGEA
jgi:hypothetical protein